MSKSFALACDHAGYAYKEAITEVLQEYKISIADFGCFGPESTDYPDYVHPAADALKDGSAELGIVVCGSGNGVAMTANKHQHIRAALCWTPEIARLARQHNDANVLAIPARFVSKDTAQEIVRAFVETPFEGGRHARRVNKIAISS